LHLELGSDLRPGRIEGLRENAAFAAVLAITLPGADEVALAVHGDGRESLRVGRVRIDGELARERGTRRVETPPEDAVIASVLSVARPRHDEVARPVHPHCRQSLGPRRIGIHRDLAADGTAVAIVDARKDSEAVAVLPVALPGDDELVILVEGDGRRILSA